MIVKALFFDVFGTLVDWRASIARETEALLKPLGFAIDWPAFADAWRAEYQPAMTEVREGRVPFCKLDVLHRKNLERILPRFGLQSVPPAVLDDLNLAWHRLDGWPDSAPGLTRLKRKFAIAPALEELHFTPPLPLATWSRASVGAAPLSSRRTCGDG